MVNKLRIIIAFAIFISYFAHGAESYIKYGIGSEKYFNHVKTVSFGYSDSVFKINKFNFLMWSSEVGFWSDIAGQGRLSSLFGSFQGGAEITATPFKASTFHGIGAITNTDIYLGSNFQFVHDMCLGLIDDMNRATVSACMKHISNGGIFSPNIGRDFIVVKIGVPF